MEHYRAAAKARERGTAKAVGAAGVRRSYTLIWNFFNLTSGAGIKCPFQCRALKTIAGYSFNTVPGYSIDIGNGITTRAKAITFSGCQFSCGASACPSQHS